MKLTGIKEAGSSNILHWALKNDAVLTKEQELLSFINDETFYLITLSDVNFFELFRLTQLYRNKLRILNEKQAIVPSAEELTIFNEEYHTPSGDTINLAEAAETSIRTFMNLAAQMMGDNDIISSSAVRLFIPMIARRFDVQIPMAFYDFFQFMDDDEKHEVFSVDYPNTINTIIENPVSGMKINFLTEVVRSLELVNPSDKYEKYLELIKYAPMKSYAHQENLYKFGLLEMFKENPIARSEVKAVLFKSTKESLSNAMRMLNKTAADLKLNFTIQLPMQYMQILLNYYDNHIIPVSYESSIKNIIANGLVYDNFKTYAYEPELQGNEESDPKEEEFNNQVEAYRVRITEANQVLLNTINAMLTHNSTAKDIPISKESIFSLLPSVYRANAVITVNSSYIDALCKDNDSIIGTMFGEMKGIIKGVNEEISKQK